jgi:hypothetical protein
MGSGAIYRGLNLQRGLGYRAREAHRAARGDAVLSQVSWPKLGYDLIGLAHLPASRREDPAYRFGRRRSWAVGQIWSWAGFGPVAPLPFFVSFVFSLFCISLITFAKEHQINSNQNLNFSKIQ